MQTESILTKGERSFLAACEKVQSLGHFPSTRNLIRHAGYTIPWRKSLPEMRDEMIARGLLALRTTPSVGGSRHPRTPAELARLDVLALAEPRLNHSEICHMVNVEFGREWTPAEVKAWVAKVRDQVEHDDTASRDEDAVIVKKRIDKEVRDAIWANANRILKLEARRAEIARIDLLPPKKACDLIRQDWKARFGPKKEKKPEPGLTLAFTREAFNSRHPTMSRRMEKARNVTCTRRHGFVPESAAG